MARELEPVPGTTEPIVSLHSSYTRQGYSSLVETGGPSLHYHVADSSVPVADRHPALRHNIIGIMNDTMVESGPIIVDHTPGFDTPVEIGLPSGQTVVAPDLSGEELKAALSKIDEGRSLDGLKNVETSAYQTWIDRSTVGPFPAEVLRSASVREFLADPQRVLVISCGRGEYARGNLEPNLNYWMEATGGANNILFADSTSMDGSADFVENAGVRAIRRQEATEQGLDLEALAEILHVPAQALAGDESDPSFPPMRKGWDMMLARIELLKMKLKGEMPKWTMWVDSDMGSIPGGKTAGKLTAEQVYYPLEIMAAGVIDLERSGLDGNPNLRAVYTGSGNRNNEAVFQSGNAEGMLAVSPFLRPDQRKLAKAFSVFTSHLVHPLTGELATLAEDELNVMGATGQLVETTRNLSLAGIQLEGLKTTDPQQLAQADIMVGNVRRGKQERIDEPQLDAKEWTMIVGMLGPGRNAIVDYSVQTGRMPHQWDLNDYRNVNRWLDDYKEVSILDADHQTRRMNRIPMERVIPPVNLLYKEGFIKV